MRQLPLLETAMNVSFRHTWNALVFASLALIGAPVLAGEGGSSHVLPGATATLADLPATAGATFVKPMFLNYKSSASAAIPTGAGVTTNLDVTLNTVVVIAGMTLEKLVLGGAHYTFAVALPYSNVDLAGTVLLPGGGNVARQTSVSGLGDITLIPAMLAWKQGEWQFNAMLPIYTPTGSYELGRLGNTGLNYWTFDPTIGAVYSTKKGFNAMLHVGYAMNTKNSATDYESGSLLHLEAAVQQMLPVGAGLMTLGVEAFYFDQITGDSGAGATLGDFKGRTSGLGPVLGYVKPLGKETLILEAKWLNEAETTKRLKGDFLWLKAVYKF
jgi:hypothetical protein